MTSPTMDLSAQGTVYATQTLPTQWSIDGLVLGALDAENCWWVLRKSDGWFGPPKPKTQRSAKFQVAGSFRNLAPRGERIVALTGTTKCPSSIARLDALDRLAAIASDPARLYTLAVTELNGRTRTMDVELDAKTDVTMVANSWFDWQLQFAAPDPRKHDLTWQAPTAGLPVGESPGLDYSTPGLDFSGVGLEFGNPGVPQYAQVVNFGTAKAYPVFQITGPVQTPFITDLSTGTTVGYAGRLVAGDVLVINCDEFPALGYPARSVFLNQTSNRRVNLVKQSSDWPTIGPGEVHNFQFEGVGYGATMTVFMRAAWI